MRNDIAKIYGKKQLLPRVHTNQLNTIDDVEQIIEKVGTNDNNNLVRRVVDE